MGSIFDFEIPFGFNVNEIFVLFVFIGNSPCFYLAVYISCYNKKYGFCTVKFNVIFDQIFIMSRRLYLAIFVFLSISNTAFAQVREIVTIAGSNITGNYGGDGGLAVNALLNGPNGVAIDPSGNVFIQDFYNKRVRKVNTAGYITTFAGDGTTGYIGSYGDNGLAPAAKLWPNGVTTDSHGNLYISDNSMSVIRKVRASTNIITTYAGNGFPGFSGDSGLAVNAKIYDPRGMCVDSKGNLYVADVNNHRVRKVDSFGKIWTFAGNGLPFYGGDGGFAIYASLDSPMDVAVDKYNNIYIADYKNNVVRKVDTNGIITTVAGNNAFIGYGGDGGPATTAALNSPRGVAVDKHGFIYIADAYNNVIRMVDTLGVITTIVGNHTAGFSGDGGPAIGANLFFPQDVVVDTFGSLFIADADNQRVRKVYFSTTGVKTVSSIYQLNAYPNPAIDEVNIAGLKVSDKVAVCDILGKQMCEAWTVKDEAVQTFPINNLNAGVYFFKVLDANGNQKAVVRVVKE